ncbi:MULTISPECIES: SufD family Fe-S cluster assembly protein [Streptobacillus]|uniref:SufBD protein n=1 Tax=Streptobacillus moniliformis (strain ATCC 14647 / DSM 12112 / NCTC 10651 / 9901) TaxID=519441 RepID=D1AV37_STRM9|nr:MULTISPECIES: SufD family Fe-S cluster assembly protein [Streptobacillus]ACZ01597.1 SufBD protein [Streptobacillus moniliformis DSM 12112]AVL43405.1 Fe-S cluster assembly protein SufD [Streptobacillus moniliformis]SQA13230.1 FeS cluster assembly protein sufD [Streptobacillus moniliformis]
MKEKKYSARLQETIDLLKSAVAEESKKASKKEVDMSFNKPVWNRMKYTVQGVEKIENFNGLKIQNLDNINIEVSENVFTKLRISNYFKYESENYANLKKRILIKGEIKEKIYITMELSKENPHLVDVFNIELEENAKAKIYIIYKGIDNESTYHNGYINVKANKGSNLELITIQTLNVNSENFLGVDIDVKEDADVKHYSVEFGGMANVTSVSSNLLENRAKSLLLPVYLSDMERKTDYEYTLNFHGRECVADIDARGVTKDRAIKVFRGNLVFERFSSKSAGSESEFSILLDKTVNAHSIPTLFCDEDDVIGAHSASIGKIDQDKLFYLMSRGFDSKSAKKLVVESSFGPVFNAIEDEDMVGELKEILERRL